MQGTKNHGNKSLLIIDVVEHIHILDVDQIPSNYFAKFSPNLLQTVKVVT